MMEPISPVIVLLKRNTKQVESEAVNYFEFKSEKKSSQFKLCSICGSSRGDGPMTKTQLCSYRQLVPLGRPRGNHSYWKRLQICDPCRQHLNQLIVLKEEMNRLRVAMDTMVKLIKLKMKYQEVEDWRKRRKSDSDPEFLNDETTSSSSTSSSTLSDEEEEFTKDEDNENLVNDDDVKPVIVNYEDDDVGDLSCLNEGRRVIDEIILKRPEIQNKRPGPWSKTRKRKREDAILPEHVKEEKNEITESEIKDGDMSSYLKVELKEQEENVENWVLCTFPENENDHNDNDTGDNDAEMILPDNNDRDDDNVVGVQGSANLNYFQSPLLLQHNNNNHNGLPTSTFTLVSSTLPVTSGGHYQILPGSLTTLQLVPNRIPAQPPVINPFNYLPQQEFGYGASNSTNNSQFITETETTEAFMPSYYSTGSDLFSGGWAQDSAMDPSVVQTTRAPIIRPLPSSLVRPPQPNVVRPPPNIILPSPPNIVRPSPPNIVRPSPPNIVRPPPPNIALSPPPIIVRPPPPNIIIRPLPTPPVHVQSFTRERFIPDQEAVCQNCGTRSRDLHFCDYCKTRLSDATKIVKVKELKETVVTKKQKERVDIDPDPELFEKKRRKQYTWKSSKPRKRGNALMKELDDLLVQASSSKHSSRSSNEDKNDDDVGESQGSDSDDDDEIQVVSEKLAPSISKPPPSFCTPDMKITLQCRTVNVGTYQTQAAGVRGFILVAICKKGIEFSMPHTQNKRSPIKCCIPMNSISKAVIHPYVVSLILEEKSYLGKLRVSLGFNSNPDDANYHYHPYSTNPRQKRITFISHDSMANRMSTLKYLIPSHVLRKLSGTQAEKIIISTTEKQRENPQSSSS